LNIFGLVERFIAAKLLETSREHWLGDQARSKHSSASATRRSSIRSCFVASSGCARTGCPQAARSWAMRNACVAACSRPTVAIHRVGLAGAALRTDAGQHEYRRAIDAHYERARATDELTPRALVPLGHENPARVHHEADSHPGVDIVHHIDA